MKWTYKKHRRSQAAFNHQQKAINEEMDEIASVVMLLTVIFEEEEAASFALRAAIRGDSRWGLVVISLSEEESESGSANDGHFSWDSSEVKRV